MKLADLHKEFIKSSQRSIVESFTPIKAVQKTEEPIFVIEKWTQDDSGFLTKSYTFESPLDKNRFVVTLLNYEAEAGHHAVMHIEKNRVRLKLKTHDVDKVSELDLEYSKYADIVRRDIAYNPQHERRL